MSNRLREWRLSRARAAREEKPAAPDPPAPDPELSEKFAKEAHDLNTIRKSVEDAASVSAGLWLSYLGLLVYLGVAAGAVTHKDLLLANPIKLPFLGDVTLPLIAFFFLAPIIFIVSHAYTLVHLVMLAAKVGVFNTELRAQLGDSPETKETKERVRRQLPSNIFVQILAGPDDLRGGGLGFLSKVIAWSSLVIGPVILLLLIQVQFLPYHHEGVTLVQRLAVLADVILLWALWPAVLNGRSEIKWPQLWRHPFLALASLVPIFVAFTLATFPGEHMDDWIGKRQWIPPNPVTALLGAKDQQDKPISTSFHDLLFHGEYDPETRRRRSPFSNSLLIPEFDALEAAKIDENKLDAIEQTFTRKKQHFESAIFRGADLRKANLENAYLQDADLYQAKLQGALLRQAHLQGASLSQARSFSTRGSKRRSFRAYNARLQGASLVGAHLQGASLEGAHLQGASLKGAHLQGASLKGAHLQGATLEGAELQGATLEGAELQGARFLKTTFAGTNMRNVVVWRTSFEDASLTAVFEDGVKESALTTDEFAALKASFMKEVPEGGQREQGLQRIGILNPDISGNEASARVILEKERGDEPAYEKSLEDQLKSLACSEDKDALHIVRGLVKNHRVMEAGAQAPGLVEAILKPDCPVFAALTDADKAALKRIANEASGAH